MTEGRPTVMTIEVIGKLEEGFSKGCTILESCLLAGISKDAYYDYLKANPSYSDRVETLRENVTLHARRNLVDSIMDGNVNDSKWYLERKKKDEFSATSNLNLGGQNGQNPIVTQIVRTIIDPVKDVE